MPKCNDCENYLGDKKCEIQNDWASEPDHDSFCGAFEPKQLEPQKTPPKIRQFDSGAYRDNDDNKLDFEACFSPLVLQRYAEYIRSKRKVPIWKDSGVRPDDNWQKGISRDSYMKSKARHFIFTWLIHRGFSAFDDKGNKVDLEDSLCAELFNTMGYLFEILKKKSEEKND